MFWLYNRILCLFGKHRWILHDAGYWHKDSFECFYCEKSIPAAFKGVYRTDIEFEEIQ